MNIYIMADMDYGLLLWLFRVSQSFNIVVKLRISALIKSFAALEMHFSPLQGATVLLK